MNPLKTNPPEQDNGFILAIQAGGLSGDKAIIALYGKYVHEITLRIARLMTRFPDDAVNHQDIVHDSFIVMLHKIRYEDPVITSIKGYWLGIARNLWLNVVKRNKRTDIAEESAGRYGHEDYTPESILMSAEWYQELEKCMTKCGGKCREILLLWLSDYSMEEISEKLNLSGPLMARKLKYQCFKKLKAMISESKELMP